VLRWRGSVGGLLEACGEVVSRGAKGMGAGVVSGTYREGEVRGERRGGRGPKSTRT